MACLAAPVATAVVTTVLRKKIPARYHIEWLNAMLWGGSIMLLVEHIAHQEIVPFPPFLTAMRSPQETWVMLKELLTVGGTMTLAIVALWAVMVLIANTVASRSTASPRA